MSGAETCQLIARTAAPAKPISPGDVRQGDQPAGRQRRVEAVSPLGLGGDDGDVLPAHLVQASHNARQQPPAAHRQQDGVRFGLQRVLQLLDQAGVTLPEAGRGGDTKGCSLVAPGASPDPGDGAKRGQELRPGSTHHTKGWSKGWMLTQPSVSASSRALLLASSHTWRGAMGAQRGHVQPSRPGDGSLITAGAGGHQKPTQGTGLRWGVPGLTPPRCRGAGDAGGGCFWMGIATQSPGIAGQAELRLSFSPPDPSFRGLPWGYLAGDLHRRPQLLQLPYGGGTGGAGDHDGGWHPQLLGRVRRCQTCVPPCGKRGSGRAPAPPPNPSHPPNITREHSAPP